MRLRGTGVGAYRGGVAEGLREVGVPPGGAPLSSRNVGPRRQGSPARRGSLGKGLQDLMERTVVRCADGHVFTTASFPMQQAERLGPGRLVRCPRCARLRSAVPVTLVGKR